MEPLVGKGGGTSVRLLTKEKRIPQGEGGGTAWLFTLLLGDVPLRCVGEWSLS